MKKSIISRVFILILGAVLLLTATICLGEEGFAASDWSSISGAEASEENDYEIVIIEPEEVPLAEGPAALQKNCVLHYALIVIAIVLFFVLRASALRIENENRDLEKFLAFSKRTEVNA